MKYAVIMEGITKSFGDRKVLKGIDLSISKGEIFGLLGPSGAGKTTLFKILTGQLKQSQGNAQLLGRDTGKLDSEIYQRVGMMMDNFGLYERLSCYDNLKLFAKIYGVPTTGVEEALTQVGLEEAKKTPVMRLSKGMRGRLALARAVMNQPDILFLDEPTSGLDPATAAEIHELIRREREKGTTIFLTTHNMEEADKLCDHIALLNEGRIVEYGEPKEICRKYNHQKKLYLRLRDGRTLEFANDSSCAEDLKELFGKELVETIHSTEPSLETVFMELTGRSFE